MIPLGTASCFTQFSLNENPFTLSDDVEEEVEEIIDTRGVRMTCNCVDTVFMNL